MDMKKYLSETQLLDFNDPAISSLVNTRGWDSLNQYGKIGGAYGFVKDEIAFGYSEKDNIPASSVLADGYGQCNTKSTLLMALLRRLGVPCRVHGFGIDKRVQKGAVPGVFYAFGPRTLLHTWVELEHEGQWMDLEGCILDEQYLAGVQTTYGIACHSVCGYGVAVDDLQNPRVQWQGASTYIQKDAIVADYGVFDTPDELYRDRGANFNDSLIRQWLFKHVVRKMMNARVARIRNTK
jgi:hypothetical protein